MRNINNTPSTPYETQMIHCNERVSEESVIGSSWGHRAVVFSDHLEHGREALWIRSHDLLESIPHASPMERNYTEYLTLL